MNKPTVFCRYCFFRFETKLQKDHIDLNGFLVKVSLKPCDECGCDGWIEVTPKETKAS